MFSLASTNQEPKPEKKMAVTPPEEIKRQQDEAMKLVKEGMKCLEMIDYGEVPLSKKKNPTSEIYNDENHQEAGAVISTRGRIDVTDIAKVIHEGYNDPSNIQKDKRKKSKNSSKKIISSDRTVPKNLWDPIVAKTENVSITRPSHDAWGIKKIVLIFCDDFLHRVYEMPWWNQQNCPIAKAMRKTIQPILSTLQISDKQVVRMLFAALPPKVTIPIHHDTGAWVKQAHRVHIPIIVEDPNLILFRCGPTPSTLQRVNAIPGHIFEMNNQAEHAVSNCSTTHHRVHLILDYVPKTHEHERIILHKGESLLQTRRTIDRKIDYGKTPTPSFIILGVQKAGTTSLYEYLNQHPRIVRAKRRETHCMDWRWDETKKTKEEQQKHCLSFYHADTLKHYPSLHTGDSTPSYLLHTHIVIPRMKQLFPWVKFMIMLRDPVKRAVSHYKMVTDPNGTPQQLKTRGKEWRTKSLMQVVQEEIQMLKEDGLIPYWNTETNSIDFNVFTNFVGSKEEDEAWSRYQNNRIPMNTGSHSLLARGLYSLQIRHWFDAFPRDQFMVIKLETMSPTFTTTSSSLSSNDDESVMLDKESNVQMVMKKVCTFLNLQFVEVEDDSAKNTRTYDQPPEGVKVIDILQNFYNAHNQMLCELLEGDEWINPWPYD